MCDALLRPSRLCELSVRALLPPDGSELELAPHGALAFELIFAPKAPGAHDFELPLELVAGGGTFDATLRASALRPMLVLSQTTVDFGERIFTPDETRRVPFSQDVVVTNHHHGTLTWRLEVGDDVECFAVTPKEGRLVPGETTPLSVAGNFSSKYPAFLESVARRLRAARRRDQ